MMFNLELTSIVLQSVAITMSLEKQNGTSQAQRVLRFSVPLLEINSWLKYSFHYYVRLFDRGKKYNWRTLFNLLLE